MKERGRPLGREAALARMPARGELLLRARLTNRGPGWDVYLATLLRPDYGYVIQPLDHASIVAIRGRWLQVVGVEVYPRSRNPKRLGASGFDQEWWCRIEGATAQGMVEPLRKPGFPPLAAMGGAGV